MPALVSPPPASSAPGEAARVEPKAHSLKTEPLSFRDAPALFASGCFAVGILLARLHWTPPALLLLVLLSAGMVAWTASRVALRVALIPLAAAWLALGAVCFEIQLQPDAQPQLIAYADNAKHTVEGRITRLGPPRVIESSTPYSEELREERSQSITLRVSAVDGGTLSGGLGPSVYAPMDALLPEFHCGDELRVTAPVHLPDRYNDPGVWDSRAYMLEQGTSVLGSTKAADVVIVPGPRHPTIGCRLQALQQNASLRLLSFADHHDARLPAWLLLSHDDAAMLSAMIAGDRTWLERRIRVGFERTGSFHLLVVSGLHLAIFAGLVFGIAGRLRLGRIVATMVTIALSFAYAIFTGFGQPVQRSFWMVNSTCWRGQSGANEARSTPSDSRVSACWQRIHARSSTRDSR